MAAGDGLPEFSSSDGVAVFLGNCDRVMEGLDWLGIPDCRPGGETPAVQTSSKGGLRGRGLFTAASGVRPSPAELLRDASFGANGGLVTDEESESMCEAQTPESEFLVCLVFGGNWGWFRDEFTEGEGPGSLRLLREALPGWIQEGRCAQNIVWDNDACHWLLDEPLTSYVALNDPANLAAMANDALYNVCASEPEYNCKDCDYNNLVMVPCARPAVSDPSKVEFVSIWLYPRQGWVWDRPQELTLGYGWEEPE
ncbi:unnamed protein product [Polarella glacialis]|uniref:Uncharacterized protein n=1 Tax=Polarella glacialis TaxID=89957 RepID=A0A813IA35_POLGL|nr:unnamed protein product [Polarella glacialis]CAE8647618.1 unnamed protein product [Polarella glacialis]